MVPYIYSRFTHNDYAANLYHLNLRCTYAYNIFASVHYTSIKKTIKKIERKVEMEYQKAHKQGYSKDGNKGQGLSLLLFVLSLQLFICQGVEIVFSSLLMMIFSIL